MMWSAAKLLVAPLLAAGVLGQFVPPPTDLITKKGYAGVNVRWKEVPAGTCEQNPNVKSYSGYADTAKDEHIFWWFFEARNQDPKEAPLTIWFNGGPGASSMIGVFSEIGPCYIGPDLKPIDRAHSWTNLSNVLFIDQPTQTGLSYSIPVPGYMDGGGNIIELPNNTCPDYAASCGTYSKADLTLTANSTAAAAPAFWKALQGFMGAFPDYARKSVNLGTESYGGHYGPVYSTYLLEQNAKNIPDTQKIELENVVIVSGWFDPKIQYESYYNFTVSPGNSYDYSPFNKSTQAQLYNSVYGPGNCLDQMKQCEETGENSVCLNADNFCGSTLNSVFETISGRDVYDIRFLMPDAFPYGYYIDYLNQPAVQKALGAYQNYSDESNPVYYDFQSTGDDGRELGTLAMCKKLVDANISVTLLHGDADFICNWLGGQVVADKIGAPGYSNAGFANISTSDGVVHGQVKQSGLFSFNRIYNGGHDLMFYQPLAVYEILERIMKRIDIATGKTKLSSDYVTKGPRTSTYKQGKAGMQFELTPDGATYNTTLNGPDPVPRWPGHGGRRRR